MQILKKGVAHSNVVAEGARYFGMLDRGVRNTVVSFAITVVFGCAGDRPLSVTPEITQETDRRSSSADLQTTRETVPNKIDSKVDVDRSIEDFISISPKGTMRQSKEGNEVLIEELARTVQTLCRTQSSVDRDQMFVRVERLLEDIGPVTTYGFRIDGTPPQPPVEAQIRRGTTKEQDAFRYVVYACNPIQVYLHGSTDEVDKHIELIQHHSPAVRWLAVKQTSFLSKEDVGLPLIAHALIGMSRDFNGRARADRVIDAVAGAMSDENGAVRELAWEIILRLDIEDIEPEVLRLYYLPIANDPQDPRAERSREIIAYLDRLIEQKKADSF